MIKEEILDNLQEFVELSARVFLDGNPPHKMCFIISSAIKELLDAFDIKTQIIEGEIYHTDWYHFWLELEDGRIIDATAGQFKKPNGDDMPPVYVGQRPDWYITDGLLILE